MRKISGNLILIYPAIIVLWILGFYFENASPLILIGYVLFFHGFFVSRNIRDIFYLSSSIILYNQIIFYDLWKAISLRKDWNEAMSFSVAILIVFILTSVAHLVLFLGLWVLKRFVKSSFFKLGAILIVLCSHLVMKFFFPWTPLLPLIETKFFRGCVMLIGEPLSLFILLYLVSTIFLKSGCRIKFVCALLLGGLYLVGDLHFEKEKEKYTVSNFSDFDILHTNLVTKDRDIDYGENETAFIEAYKNLFKNIQSRAVQKNGLLIWPESSLPNFAFQDPTNQAITSTLLSQTPYAQHIVGTTSANNHLNYNSLYYVESVNPLKILSRYDKLKLIPIGEYNVISPGNSEYVRGRGVTTFMYGKTKILPLICYEGLWPLTDSARKALTVETQQRVIVIPSNDWWFQSRNLNRVLLFIHRWLALKNEVSVIKVSNGGYSYHITPIGEINIIETRQMMNILSVSLPFKRAP